MAIVSEETKKRIESMTDEEIEFEINLGRRSHFQRESFAWIQTVKSQRDKLAQKSRDEENDAMMRAFHKVPLAHKLEVMPEIELAGLQSQVPSDSPGKIIIENEWQRRQLSKVPNPTTTPTDSKPPKTSENKEWDQRPIGYIGITVVAGILILLAAYIIKKHFGIPL